MKFKQLQALKKGAYQAFADGKRLDVPDQDAAHLDSINLAFVGDAYYALILRKRLVETGIPHVQVLHTLLVVVELRLHVVLVNALGDAADHVWSFSR